MRILGIDLGSTSVKAVELDSAFGRYEIRDYYEQKVESGTSALQALARLLESLPKSPDRIAMALPTRRVTFRNLKLPTRDRKAIQTGVAFELEDELPFTLDKAVFDYSVVAQSKQGTELHVSATLKQHLGESLSQWQEAGADPDVVTTEAWAYRNLVNRLVPRSEQEQPILLADLGHERSVLYIHWHGAPVMAREISWGGRDLTDAIARKYALAPEQAETAKLDHGFVVSEDQKAEITPEQNEFSDTLMEPLQELISHLKQIEFTCKNLTHQGLSRIYLAGGTVQLPGLIRVLEEHAMLPVRQIRALSSVAASGVTYSDHTDAVFGLAASLALGMVGPERGALTNFRKDEFAKVGRARGLNLENLRRPLLAGAAVTASLIVSLLVESSIYRSRIQDADAQLEKSLRSFFGTISGSAVRTYLSNTETLKSSINKELSKQRDLSRVGEPNPRSPLDFLKTLSAAVPRDVVVDMLEYQVGAAATASYAESQAQTVSLTFLVPNPQLAERLASVLSPRISGLQRGKTEETTAPDGTKRWKIQFTGQPNEASYGK